MDNYKYSEKMLLVIYTLFAYYFSEIEIIRILAKNKTLYECIDSDIKIAIEYVQDFKKRIICKLYNLNIAKMLEDNEERNIIIMKLEKLKNDVLLKIDKDSAKEIVFRIDYLIKAIKDLDKLTTCVNDYYSIKDNDKNIDYDVIEKNSNRYVGEFLTKNNLSVKDLPKHSKCLIDEDIWNELNETINKENIS